MTLVEVVILLGAQCLSPMESGPGLTEVGKVPCAVLVRSDPQTSKVEFVPPSAATDPAVVAMLVKPREGVAIAKADRITPAADDVTGSITPAPPPVVVPTSADVEPDATVAKPRPLLPKKRVVKTAAPVKAAAVTHRSDVCGSYKPVWYTNKDGRRRYRCVKSG